MDLGLANKSALVVGGSRGIGRTISRTLLDEGCNLAIAARTGSDIAETQNGVEDRTSGHVCDVSDRDQCVKLIDDVVTRWGGLDIVISSLGNGASVPPGSEMPDEWRRMFDINFFSSMNLIAAARPALKRDREDECSSITLISSICGQETLGAPVTYSAAKAALNAAIKGLSRPLALEGIRLNSVAPGNILCEGGVWDRKLKDDRAGVEAMLRREVALMRLGTPEEIASAVTYVASPKASFVVGEVFVVDGGQVRS